MESCRHTVLCVDDEKNILNSLKRLLRKEDYRFLTADSCDKALALLQQHDIQVVITDQRMPEMSGTEFLAQVKEDHPDVIRIVLSGYTEVDAITEAINKGSVYKFFLKPWNDQNLKQEIRKALEHYELVKSNRQLHGRVVAQNEALKQTNQNLETLVQQRTRTLEIQNRALEMSQAILDDLPVPVVGVGADGVIVFMNRSSQSLFSNGQCPQLGSTVAECFDAPQADRITAGLSLVASEVIWGEFKDDHGGYRMYVKPLAGRFSGQGVVVTFLPAALITDNDVESVN